MPTNSTCCSTTGCAPYTSRDSRVAFEVAAGLAVGLPASLFAARFLEGMLFGVGTGDPVTYAGVAVFLGGVAATACALPGLRASRVDPAVAFRAE